MNQHGFFFESGKNVAVPLCLNTYNVTVSKIKQNGNGNSKKTFGLVHQRRRRRPQRRPGSSNRGGELARELGVWGERRRRRRGEDSVSESDWVNCESKAREKRGEIKERLTESQEEMRRVLEWGANRVREMASPISFSNSNSNQSPFILVCARNWNNSFLKFEFSRSQMRMLVVVG